MKGLMAKQRYDDEAEKGNKGNKGNKGHMPVETGENGPENGQTARNPQEPEEGEAATPEEEQAMASFLNAALAAIHSEQSHPGILQTLQGGSRPDQALADTAVAITMEIDRQSGGKVPETVILPGAMAVLGLLAEVAEASGTLQIDDTVMAAAAQQMTLSLLREYGANPQDFQAVMQKLGPEKVRALVAEQQRMAGSWAGGDQQAPQQQQPETG